MSIFRIYRVSLVNFVLDSEYCYIHGKKNDLLHIDRKPIIFFFFANTSDNMNIANPGCMRFIRTNRVTITCLEYNSFTTYFSRAIPTGGGGSNTTRLRRVVYGVRLEIRIDERRDLTTETARSKRMR